jgi:sugar lactone lactonase YvrE
VHAVEALAWGYGLVEGPSFARDGSVYFSDVLGGGVHRWSPGGEVETVLPKRRGIGGIVLHADGGLVVSGRDVAHVKDGETRTLLALEGVTGFNDMAADSAGRVYVGALRFRPFGGEQPVPGEVWRIDPGGEAIELFGGIDWANGIGFSPDGRTVYCSDFAHGLVLAHDLGGDGAGNRRAFARSPSGGADGLAVDERGGVWVALGQGGGVGCFAPDGSLDRVLDVPASFVSSVCFGGDDMRDVYVTTADNSEDPDRRGTLFRTRVDVPGLPVGAATV